MYIRLSGQRRLRAAQRCRHLCRYACKDATGARPEDISRGTVRNLRRPDTQTSEPKAILPITNRTGCNICHTIRNGSAKNKVHNINAVLRRQRQQAVSGVLTLHSELYRRSLRARILPSERVSVTMVTPLSKGEDRRRPERSWYCVDMTSVSDKIVSTPEPSA